MRTPLDEALARLRATEDRLALETTFADAVMGSDTRRWELLAALAAWPEEDFRTLMEEWSTRADGAIQAAAQAYLVDEARLVKET